MARSHYTLMFLLGSDIDLEFHSSDLVSIHFPFPPHSIQCVFCIFALLRYTILVHLFA